MEIDVKQVSNAGLKKKKNSKESSVNAPQEEQQIKTEKKPVALDPLVRVVHVYNKEGSYVALK